MKPILVCLYLLFDVNGSPAQTDTGTRLVEKCIIVSVSADLIATKLLEDLKATQMIQSSWGLQDEGLNTDGLKKALIQLQKVSL